MANRRLKAGFAGGLALCMAFAASAQPDAPNTVDRPPEDEVIYFVMPDRFENGDPDNDRGGLSGDRLTHGYDPTDHGFYHGGDLAGLTARLDYIQGLGATAIWLTPIFENKPVQGSAGAESSGYHGYWITDFTNVDPHLGTREDFATFVESAHARGMKVYMDIITNHTADVIKYAECHGPNPSVDKAHPDDCPYRPLGAYPFSTRGDLSGEAINNGFLGLDPEDQTTENFAQLTDTTFAYTPFLPEGDESVKNPPWLNNPLYYNNRGDSTWEGESVQLGDFAGLDDLMTEHPDVVAGMIAIFQQWITDYRVDGFRIDTAKHVNPEFWQAFVPAILDHAHSLGIDHFHIFGEVYDFDAGQLARFTHVDRFPTVLDFAFQGAVQAYVTGNAPAESMDRLFRMDDVYAGGFTTATQTPTFLGNHDMGRFAMFLREAHPDADDEETLARLSLAHAVMFASRGTPTIYYGDEQGFVSDGGDRPARENMFPSQVASYNDNDLIGADTTTADNNFDMSHPLYETIAELAAMRRDHDAFRAGRQIVRYAETDGGVLAIERESVDGEHVYLAVFNADAEDRQVDIPIDARVQRWMSLLGTCPTESTAPGAMRLTVPALGYMVCRSEGTL